jgi:hypothetical protein
MGIAEVSALSPIECLTEVVIPVRIPARLVRLIILEAEEL